MCIRDRNNSGSNYFPITLTYNLEEVSDVDYLVYYPRTDGANGKFKEVDVYKRQLLLCLYT